MVEESEGGNESNVQVSDLESFHQPREITEDGCILGRKMVSPVFERLSL